MKIDKLVGWIGNWAIERTKDGQYVASLSISNSERLQLGPFDTQKQASDACLKQDKGFEDSIQCEQCSNEAEGSLNGILLCRKCIDKEPKEEFQWVRD